MHRYAKLGCPFVQREVGRCPARILRRPRVKIVSAVAERCENGRRHDYLRGERDQPGAGKHGGVEGHQILESGGRMND
jgi:hypothetical protein